MRRAPLPHGKTRLDAEVPAALDRPARRGCCDPDRPDPDRADRARRRIRQGFRYLQAARPVHERVPEGARGLCRQDRRQGADQGRDRRHAGQPRSAQLLHGRARLPADEADDRRQLWRPRPHRAGAGRRGEGGGADAGHPGLSRRHQIGRLYHPHRRQADLRFDARRRGRPDARRAGHQGEAHPRPPRPRQAVRCHPHPRDHRHQAGEVGGEERHRHHHYHQLLQADWRRHPRRDCRDRQAGGRQAYGLHHRSTLQPRWAARSGDRGGRRLPRSWRDRLAARPHQGRYRALLRAPRR